MSKRYEFWVRKGLASYTEWGSAEEIIARFQRMLEGQSIVAGRLEFEDGTELAFEMQEKPDV